MSHTVAYTLSLVDRASAPMRTITGASAQTVDKFSRLQSQSKLLQASTKDLGGSLSTLRQRMELIRGEKELINPRNLKDIKQYNREIQSLEKQIDKLDNAGRKGGLSSYFGSLKSMIGGIVNPLTLAAAGVGLAVGGGISLDEQFAKVNITAQLDGKAFEQMKSDIISTAKKNKVDVAMAPGAFEQIISQTNDVDLSMKILDSTLKGSKAGFTDTAIVAGALAQSLSIIGKDNASADEILDTFFAAKRVGAGEFQDFATYMPSLIASADALGIKYKEVAGVFAYMTGKGQKPERAAVLMNNMFSMLGRGEVVSKLQKAGIKIFDNGQIRSTVDIFKDMSAVMSTMDDQTKSNFIEKMGIVDKEAKSSFMVMSADVDKLQSSLTECANAAGETDRTLAFSANTAQRSREIWNDFKSKLIEAGTAALPIVNTGITILGGALEVASVIIGGLTSFMGGWYDMLADGNPIIWACTAALGAAGLMLAAHKIKLMAVSAWNAITSLSTGVLSRAMTALKASMLSSPVGWLLLGVGALAGAMMSIGSKTDSATKSLAAFNVELAKSKGEAKGSFDSAMQAAAGSDARKEAINKLNTQYGTYLPNLLTEKSSNDELTVSLGLVNSQLEQKLKLKYRDQLLDAAKNQLMEAETAMYETVLNGIDDVGKQRQLTDKLKDVQSRVASGQLAPDKAIMEVQTLKSALSDNFHLVDLVKGNLINGGAFGDFADAAENLNRVTRIAEAQFGESKTNTQPITVSPNITVQWGGLEQYGIPTTASNQQWIPMSPAASATPIVADTNINTDKKKEPSKNPLDIFSGGGGKSSASNVFNLDQQATNSKGSTAYNAVVSKLGRVKMASLAAASLIGVAATSPALTVPQISDGASTQVFATNDSEDYNKKDKTLNLDKFCDQIVIHVANANDKGYDKIRQEVMQVLKELADGQQA